MALYDVTTPKATKVKTSEAESYEVIQAVRRKVHPATWDRIVQTVDEGINSIVETGDSKFVWTRSAALFGHGSVRPKRHIDHLWENVVSAVGEDKECLQAVGGLLRWRISQRPETWLVYRQENGEIDPTTGKKITVSEYWINEDFKRGR